MVKLGTIYVRQGRMAKAEKLFRQALELEPDTIEARYQLGLCRYERHDYAETAHCMEAVCGEKLDYGYGLAQLRLAQSLDRLDDCSGPKESTPSFSASTTLIPKARSVTPNCSAAPARTTKRPMCCERWYGRRACHLGSNAGAIAIGSGRAQWRLWRSPGADTGV